MVFERKNNAKLPLLVLWLRFEKNLKLIIEGWARICAHAVSVIPAWAQKTCPPHRAVVVAFCIAIGLGAPVSSHAGITSTYRYKLIKSADKKVCKHMLDVYNTHFKKPWDTPYPPTNETYGENSSYAFPKLPGIQHDPRLAHEMRFFRQPTSPEFEAIKWVEGRKEIGMGENIPYRPVLWANFDIDNDGKLETVWAAGFYDSWQNSREKGHNGAEYLYVFPQRTVSVNPNLTQREAIELIHGKNPGAIQPRLLSNMADNHLGIGLRPFIFGGVTYLSSYDQQWRHYPVSLAGPKSETIEILKYKSGGDREVAGRYLRSKVITEQICKFRMIPADKYPK